MTAVAAPTLRIGTRGSRLALVQTGLVADGLRALGVPVEVVPIETEGDRRAPDTPWGEGAFVTAIESALLDGSIDVAVHSAKDVPTEEDPRLAIAAFLPRELPEDVLVVRPGERLGSVDDLPSGARVGTDSPRRTAFLRALRPDLDVHPLHGNVDTRLRRLDAGETDALVLAAAGLRRIGQTARISATLPVEVVPPAPGQGALAVQVRAGDPAEPLVAALDDPGTRRAVVAERSLLQAAGGGCRAPIGALARDEEDGLVLRAAMATSDGAVVGRITRRLDRGASLDGAALELADTMSEAARARGRPAVVVTRPRADAVATVLALIEAGFAPRIVPTIAVEPVPDLDPGRLVERLAAADWVAVSSANAVRALAALVGETDRGLRGTPARWAAVGPGTRKALVAVGVAASFVSPDRSGAGLAALLPVRAGERVVLPIGDRSGAELAAGLEARGARVDRVVVYRTTVAPTASLEGMRQALEDAPVAVLAASPSAVQGWRELAAASGLRESALAIPVLAIGPTTRAAVERAGLRSLGEAPEPDPDSLAHALRRALDPTRPTEESP